MLQFHSGLPHLFSFWIPRDGNAVPASGILKAMGFWDPKGRILPQGTTSATKYSRIVILRDREREKRPFLPSGKGQGLQEKDSGLRNAWTEREGGKRRGERWQ